jgi:hypothetical protein
MNQRSEGIKRLVIVLSFLSATAWVMYVFIASEAFSEMGEAGWLIFVAGIPVTYFIPPLITKAIYWVKDGFNQDKNT